VADKIAAMADRFRTEIDTGDEETEAKKTDGADDEILEYAVAIAFATALALGEKPELFSFEQSMCTHLRQCLIKREMEMFPVSRKRRVKKSLVKSTEEIPVYCNARITW